MRRPPRSTRTDTSFPTRRSSDLPFALSLSKGRSFFRPPKNKDGASTSSARTDLMCFLCRKLVARDAIHEHAYPDHRRSEEHTSELQSLMRISYAVFCLKKKN